MNEIDHKKEYLKQYEKAVRQMKRSEEKITEMPACHTHITIQIYLLMLHYWTKRKDGT